ncbi:MAG TPA: 50S ribosomal protein L23 [Crocinitomicaceae bacterium]|nr:50S ribosomal protein L23 [Crocinitomicaceae bacterium]
MQDIIKQPVLTEKSNMLSEKKNTYTFIVDKNSNKIEIKNAIEKLYNVAVDSVNTMNYGGGKKKMKQTSRGISYQRNKQIKKAIVTVAEGDIIDLYENI